MKKHIFILSILSFLLFGNLLAQNEIVGKWKTQDKEAIVKIYKAKNGKYYGKITWLKKPNDKNGKPFTDSENPNKSLRNKPLLGLVMLKSFEYSARQWKKGTIYDPTDGKSYQAKMWLSGNNILNVRGYWGLFYQTEKWTRIK